MAAKVVQARTVPKKKLKTSKLRAALVIFLTFYLALMLITVSFFLLVLYRTEKSENAMSLKVTYQDGKSSAYDADDVYFNDTLYIPYTELDNLCDFIITGDKDRITLIVRTGDDYCTLYNNSQFMYVGNVPFRLTAPVVFSDDDYYIPIEVIENYMVGLDIVYDNDKDICTVSLDGSNKITFVGKYQTSPEAIKESDIPVVGG